MRKGHNEINVVAVVQSVVFMVVFPDKFLQATYLEKGFGLNATRILKLNELLLVEALWDSIAADPEEAEVLSPKTESMMGQLTRK